MTQERYNVPYAPSCRCHACAGGYVRFHFWYSKENYR